MTQLRTFLQTGDFLALMRPWLEKNESLNGLMLGITERLHRHPERIERQPFFAVVEDGDGVAAAAVMTPPYGVILYSPRQECAAALDLIAVELLGNGWPVPTANGLVYLSSAFARIWTERTGVTAVQKMAQRVFELRRVHPPLYSPGFLRVVEAADADLLVLWLKAFGDEALTGIEQQSPEEVRRHVLLRIEDGSLYLWIDERPVCLVGTTRPTARGISVGPVYTPPEYRNRGYASSCVAQVSQRMLDAGKEFCALYTDLANPTSNSIYQKLGYRPIGDFALFAFG
jgi:GNAT superfamily N-acetyltransferase